MRQLNLEVSSFFSDSFHTFENIDYYLKMLYCFGRLERGMRNLEEEVEVKMTSKDVQHKLEARSNMTSSQPQPPGPVCHKMDAQDTFGLGF